MATKRVFTVEGSSVSDGNSDELTDSDNSDWVIEQIAVVDEQNNLGDTSDVTIKVAGNSLTDQVIPLTELTEPVDGLPVWNAYWPANNQLEFSYTNESGSAITLDFIVYVRSGADVSDDTQPGETLSTPLGGS